MLIEVLQILPNAVVTIKIIKQTGQHPEKPPETGEQYTIYFEKVEPEHISEYNK